MHVHAGDMRNAKTSRVLRISSESRCLHCAAGGCRPTSAQPGPAVGGGPQPYRLSALLMSWARVSAGPAAQRAQDVWLPSRGVLAALSMASPGLISFYIWFEAFKRLQTPVSVDAGVMIWWRRGRGDEWRDRAAADARSSRHQPARALLHEIGDTLSTAAVIVGGIVIALTGQHWIDPALSVASA